MAATCDGKSDLNSEEILDDFACLDVFENESRSSTKRPTCSRCRRPMTVCWCPFLPREPLNIRTTLYILQHPFEESRCLRTVPILQNSIPSHMCHVIRGKRFPQSRFPHLMSILESPNTILLYPGENAVDLSELPTDQIYNLVLLDGTWTQARGLYTQNPILQTLKKVQIKIDQKSKYVIRTQPSDSSLSTLETAAFAIATLEGRPDIEEALTQPLVALCNFQLQHGATEHQSRQYKVENGLWTKPLSNSTRKWLAERCDHVNNTANT